MKLINLKIINFIAKKTGRISDVCIKNNIYVHTFEGCINKTNRSWHLGYNLRTYILAA